MLSSQQLPDFRIGKSIQQEVDVKAEKGAYFNYARVELTANGDKEWMMMADVNKNHAAIAQLSATISSESALISLIKEDIQKGTDNLIKLNGASDGLQQTEDPLVDARHFSNTLFNIMRGGIFDDNYQIEKWDFAPYLSKANKDVYQKNKASIDALPAQFSLQDLRQLAGQSTDPNFKRLCLEYMPLKFSRRHGDPSRPWNRFSINTRNEEDGTKILDYEGNWRDIFQNWEALAYSYPGFVESMIHKFLNATTFDGYNPYRVTKDGFDWETIEPDDPWSYIGYWGDHQIIYLLKLMEFSEQYAPGTLTAYFGQDCFVYANVPYRIKNHSEILKNSKDTIDFDLLSDTQIRNRRDQIGADGALLTDPNQSIYQVNFIEKILATLLAKMANFIPEGGIWMNTQRPEWNDANNALVGNGVSMVTLYYLRRFLVFLEGLLAKSETAQLPISNELWSYFQRMRETLLDHQSILSGPVKDETRKSILDQLGQSASDYRGGIYDKGFSGNKQELSLEDLKEFVALGLQYLEHSIRANKRSDHLYHAYNLMSVVGDDKVEISYLSEMLEGQVAVLSAGYLSGQEVVGLLDSMKASQLYRPDQYSYLLYPNKDLPRFQDKNTISEQAIRQSALLTKLVEDGNTKVVQKDVKGQFHFNGNFKNANDLKEALDQLAGTIYEDLVEIERTRVLQEFEAIFNHKAFTGRSGTFFGYEGLGSIYWHMVSKLRLAVQECCLRAISNQEEEAVIRKLIAHYYEINAGIGVHKPPTLYGAFPTDPYSHTPAGKGAQQPGMTGQVKEDILSRFGELGVFISDGAIHFNPCLLKQSEFLTQSRTFNYVDLASNTQQLVLEPGEIGFTFCQVPIIYRLVEEESIAIHFKDGTSEQIDSLGLNSALSSHIFNRTGKVSRLLVGVSPNRLS